MKWGCVRSDIAFYLVLAAMFAGVCIFFSFDFHSTQGPVAPVAVHSIRAASTATHQATDVLGEQRNIMTSSSGTSTPATMVNLYLKWVPLTLLNLSSSTTSHSYREERNTILLSGNLPVSIVNWSSSEPIIGADPDTFEVAVNANGEPTLYARDKIRVYYAGNPVDVDRPTFNVIISFAELPGEADQTWSTDTHHVYFAYGTQEILPGADPATFRPIFDESGYLVGFQDRSYQYDTNNRVVR